MRRLLSAAAAALVAGAIARADMPFDGCGQIVMGVECQMFAADAGGTYYIGRPPGIQVGDRVHVTGKINPSCITFCQQGNGCIGVQSIGPCDPGCLCEFDGAAGVTIFDLLAFLDLWFARDPGANLDDIPEVDVHDLLAFLDCWFPASSGGTCP